jgi:molybdate transport system substrate-binding protein
VRRARSGSGIGLVVAALVAAWVAGCAAPRKAPEKPLLIMGAASLAEVLPRVGEAWATRGHLPPQFTFDGSSRLARQIEAGAPGDVFVSADTAWMDALVRRELVAAPTRVDLLGNRLVVIVAGTDNRGMTSLAELGNAGWSRVAVAGEAVPAGRYARAALESAGVLGAVTPRIVSADNVRSALAWVAGGDVDVGIVYATDARVEPGVRVLYEIPAELSPPVTYAAAVVARSANPAEARNFLQFCRGVEARAIFEAAGFRHLPTGNS